MPYCVNLGEILARLPEEVTNKEREVESDPKKKVRGR